MRTCRKDTAGPCAHKRMTRRIVKKTLSFASAVLIGVCSVFGAVPAAADEAGWAGRVVVPGDTVTGMDELYVGDGNYSTGIAEDTPNGEWLNTTPWAYMTVPVNALVQPAPAESVGESSTEAETAPAPAPRTAYMLERLGMVVELENASFPDPVSEVFMPDAALADDEGNTRTAHFTCAYFGEGNTVAVKADDAPEGMVFDTWEAVLTDPEEGEAETPVSMKDLGLEEENGKQPFLSFPMPVEEKVLRLRPRYAPAPAQTEPASEAAPEPEMSAEEMKEFVPRAVSLACAPEGAGTAEISLDGLVPDDQGNVRAVGGQTVTVLAYANEGYGVKSITAAGTSGDVIASGAEGDGQFSFVMPDDDVNVAVEFGLSSGEETEAEPAEEETAEGQDGEAAAAEETPESAEAPAQASAETADGQTPGDEDDEARDKQTFEELEDFIGKVESGEISEDSGGTVPETDPDTGEPVAETPAAQEQETPGPQEAEEAPEDGIYAPGGATDTADGQTAEEIPAQQPETQAAQVPAEETPAPEVQTESMIPQEAPAAQEAPGTAVHKVSFDSMGGSDVMSQPVGDGTPVIEPEIPVREGFAFGGWYADEALTVLYDFAAPVTSDMTLYAKWDRPAGENTGTEEPAATETPGEQPEEAAAPPEQPAEEPVAAETPAEQPETGAAQETDMQQPETPAEENTVSENIPAENTASAEAAPEPEMHAEETPAENVQEQPGPETQQEVTAPENAPQEDTPQSVVHKVSFDSAGGSEVMSQAVEDGNRAVRPEDPAREGSAFGGWYADEALTTPYDFDAAVVSDITLHAAWGDAVQDAPEEDKKEEEPPAQPEEPEQPGGDEKTSFTVTFDSAGGSEVPPQNVEEGGTVGMPEDPTREGFTFGGWFSDAELTTPYAFDTPVTGEFTLFAKWDEVTTTKTVTFNSNGGSEVPAQTVENGAAATWPQDPAREGFTFRGWYADEALTVPYAFTEPVTEDITLFAKWEGNAATHSVTVETPQNGTLSVDRNVAAAGETVAVTATPASGYRTSSVSAKTADGTPVAVSDGTFTMPDADVVVSAAFEDDSANRQYSVTAAGSYASSVTLSASSAKAGESVTASMKSQWDRASVTWDVKDASGNTVPSAPQDDGWTVNFIMPASNATVTAAVTIAQTYPLTVNGGTGTGKYYEGDTVTITAGKPEEGKDFSSWTSSTGNVSFANAAAATTTITMPAAQASVTANYSKAMRSLTVKNGTGGGTFATGATVDISASTPEDGKQFLEWKVTEGDVKITDASRISTSAVIGLKNSTVKAVYRESPKAEENRIEGLENGRAYAVEQKLEFTAGGAGMDNANPNRGYRRWLPTDYSVNTVRGRWDNAPYKTAMAIRAVGEYTVTVNFARQIFDGNNWVNDGKTDSKSITFRISDNPDAENAANGFGGGDANGGSQSVNGYQVQTGDSSPIALLAVVAGAAAVIAGAVLLIILKRRKK